MFWLLLPLLVKTCVAAEDQGDFTRNLKWMAHGASWGAANERKYGKDMGSWDHLWAKATAHLDAVKEAVDDDSITNLINTMSINAAWGAANERAWGKKSSAQVDWNAHHHDVGKLEGKMNNDKLATALQRVTFEAAWWAANALSYGETNQDAKDNRDAFETHMQEVKDFAPKGWPIEELRGLLKNNAWAAASHRHANLKETKFMTGQQKEHGTDWLSFEKHAQGLKKFLGPDQFELYTHLENMVTSASWGAVNERWYGRTSNSAKINWEKFNFHEKEGRKVYTGPCDWDALKEMLTGAAWGAANERAYGAESQDAKSGWNRWEKNAAKLIASGESNGEL